MNLRNLPETLRTRIERARVKAEHRFREDEKRVPGYYGPHIPGKPCPWFVRSAEARRLLIDRIKNEVLEDAHEVNVCARNGELKPMDIGKIVEEILEVRCANLCPDPYKSMGDRSYKFLGEVKEILFGSTEWEAHLEERAEALDALVGSDDTQSPARSADFSWQNVVLRFTSENMIQITIGDQHVQPPQSYEDLGFADGRTKNPSFAWQALQELARLGGKLGSVPKDCLWAKDWPAVEKRMEELRKILRERFKTADDPVPFETGIGYKTAFRIDPGSAFDTDPGSAFD